MALLNLLHVAPTPFCRSGCLPTIDVPLQEVSTLLSHDVRVLLVVCLPGSKLILNFLHDLLLYICQQVIYVCIIQHRICTAAA